MRSHISYKIQDTRDNSKNLGKRWDFQYLFHSSASIVFSFILVHTSDLHQHIFLCLYCLNPCHLSSCFLLTYYYCFLKVVFLFSRLEFRYLLSQRLMFLARSWVSWLLREKRFRKQVVLRELHFSSQMSITYFWGQHCELYREKSHGFQPQRNDNL